MRHSPRQGSHMQRGSTRCAGRAVMDELQLAISPATRSCRQACSLVGALITRVCCAKYPRGLRSSSASSWLDRAAHTTTASSLQIAPHTPPMKHLPG